MKCTILHESRGRMRVHVNAVRMTLHRADVLEAYLNHSEAIEHAKVYERTGDVLIQYKGSRAGAVTVLSHYKFDNPELDSLVTSADSRKINQEYQERFVNLVVFRAFHKLFLPAPVRAVITVFKAIEFICRGLVCLWHRKLEVEVLDALSIGVSLLRGDFNTAGSLMFLLNVGALLEEWTRKKSLDDLARSMSLNVDRVWVRSQGTEVLMPITKVKAGDEIIVRSGNMVPLDGTVIEGEAMVNQAALTGESMPVRKIAGATVYAGTVVEEGECVFAANAVDGASRYDKIVSMIEESEKLKSGTENHALELADRLVPWCLAGTVVTYALTRNVTRAISILMVDFSCALKLSMPLAVLSAMRECGSYHITVKGGKYLEALSKADTIVFDKTGTLTHASPKVVKVVPFSGCDEEEVLKLAACLEEHFPHSMANAVVRAAKERGITHEEMHTEVEYIVAHGIASRVRGERVVIGSHHFVFEDEKCVIPAAEQQKFDDLEPEYSHLYLAACGQLVGVICIADPLRPEARHVLRQLRAIGVTNTVMMTGDSDRTAAAIARQVGVDQYFSEVLPEDKAEYVQKAKAEGHTVVMIGDGINDAPALKAAQVGLSMGDGTSVAKEASDITIIDNSFSSITRAVMWGRSLYRNIQKFLLFQLTINVAACLIVLLGSLLGTESPLTITQMLWVNLIMDTFAAGALASLPPNERVMKDKPRRSGKDGDFIITRPMAYNIFGVGFAFVVILMGLLFYFHAQDGLTPHDLSWFFSFFVMLQFWNMFNAKAFMEGRSAFANLKDSKSFLLVALLILIGQYLIVTFGGEMFSVIPLSLRDWAIIIGSSSLVLWIGELFRLFKR